MANLKNITELPVVESADGLNLIVNDNGSAKQISADLVGGAASWNDLTDKPFYTSEKTLLEQRALDGFIENETADGYVFRASDIRIDFPNSGTVSIYWDGEIYNCEVRCLYENDEAIEIEVGNSYLFDNTQNNSGEPFYLYYDALKHMVDANNLEIRTNSSGSSHTIGIIGEDVHTIDEKFIPDSVKNGVFVIDSTTATWGDAAKEALLRGDTVYVSAGGAAYTLVTGFDLYTDASGNNWLAVVCNLVSYGAGTGAFNNTLKTYRAFVTSVEVD